MNGKQVLEIELRELAARTVKIKLNNLREKGSAK